jgi:DNA-binding transcriptional regulator YdaS (Cro superfamily)
MKLIDYLNALPVQARENFAARCGTSFDYLRQVGYGNRPCSETLAINLERESDRALICETLCPKADWAFIRSTCTSQNIDRTKPPSA